MGNIPGAGGTTTSFSNTPQAKDDSYVFIEDVLVANSSLYNTLTKTITLDVMSNDLGGMAKSLFSIDDGFGNQITDLSQTDLLTNTSLSNWQLTAGGNQMRIFNGKVEYRLGNMPGQGLNVETLNAGQTINDSFTYAIKLGNGTLSWARVNISLTGSNDLATITGSATGTVIEAGGINNALAGTPTVGGTLTVQDVDSGQSSFAPVAPGNLIGTYGNFTFNSSTGVWTYTLNNNSTATQGLAQGEQRTETLTVASLDGTATQLVTITITGTNDSPVITTAAGQAVGTVVEAGNLDNGTVVPGTPVVSGQLSSSDVDDGATATWSGSLDSPYGAFAITAAGAWTYTLDNAAAQALAEGVSASETFTVTVIDDFGATAQQNVVITITGTNDSPDLRAVTTDTISSVQTETNAALTASGTLTVTDPDTTDTIASSVTSVTLGGTTGSLASAAVLGMLSVAPVSGLAANSGDTHNLGWAFSSGSQAFDYLGAGQSLTLTYTVTISDGHGGTDTQNITVTINGTNDAAVISGTSTGSVIEAGTTNGGGTPTAMGTLTDTDVDNPTNTFTASAGSATYGTYAMTIGGVWTYTLNNANAAVNALNVGGSLSDSFVVTTIDGTQKTVNVTIAGANDAAVISGATTGSVTEDAVPNTVGGDLNSTDVDGATDAWTAVTTATASANGYGSFTMDATGHWSYALNNANAAVNALNTGGTLNDSFTVTTADGTAQIVTVVINGVTDVAVPAPNDLVFTVTAAGINGNGAPNGDFAQLSVGNAVGGAIYTYGATNLTATTLSGGVATNVAGDITVNSSGVVTGTSVDVDRVYELTVQVTNGGNSYNETFSIVVGTNSGVDTINGAYISGDDAIFAVGGDDIVFAGSGNDTVFGQAGEDKIHGGSGNDLLFGAAGKDEFYFDTALNSSSNVDVIKDFDATNTDKIALDDAIFAALGSSGTRNLLVANFASNAGGNALDANDFILFDSATGNLFYDADGSGAGAKVLFAQLDLSGLVGGTAGVDVTDFFII